MAESTQARSSSPPLVLLIGLRASGKTSIGRRLATAWRVPFHDLDDLVLALLGEESVRAVWETRGESAWRDAELDAARRFMSDPQGVLALGGGTPMIPGVQSLITAAPGPLMIVYLRAPKAVLESRLHQAIGDRPPLVGSDSASEVATVLAIRDPIYQRLATHTIDCGNRPIDEITAEILGLPGI